MRKSNGTGRSNVLQVFINHYRDFKSRSEKQGFKTHYVLYEDFKYNDDKRIIKKV